MSQTRFIIGFALASLAFVAGGLAVVLILEFGKIPTSPIWNGLAAVTALVAAWLAACVHARDCAAMEGSGL